MHNYYLELVEKFNKTFGKLNNYTPQIPNETERKFIYNFILEELNEYKEAYENNDLVGVLDAFADIQYVLNAGIMAFGLKDVFKAAYDEVQRSNMSKSCVDETEAQATIASLSEDNLPAHYEYREDEKVWVVYRSSDRKVMKSIFYSKPDLKSILDKYMASLEPVNPLGSYAVLFKCTAYFSRIDSKNMYYTFEWDKRTWEFPIPLNDIDGGVFNHVEKANLLTRWVRKAVENNELRVKNT